LERISAIKDDIFQLILLNKSVKIPFKILGVTIARKVLPFCHMNCQRKLTSEKSTLLKKLNLPAFTYPIIFSTFPLLIKVSIGRGGAKGGLCVWNIPDRQFVGKLSNPSWIGRKETKTFGIKI
jgi:hypothetical protein